MFKKILFATDGSAASNHAAEMAVSLARIHGAKLTADVRQCTSNFRIIP